jgi:hypothetical protein
MSGNAARAGWKIPKGRWCCQQAWGPSTPFGWRLTTLRMTFFGVEQSAGVSLGLRMTSPGVEQSAGASLGLG